MSLRFYKIFKQINNKMELKEINELLKYVADFEYKNKQYKKVLNKHIDENDTTSDRVEVYDLSNDLFLQIVTSFDSYSDNERVTSIQFVKPIIKQITDFEQI